MKIFLDTANTEEISKGIATGIVTGVTTNPTIISRENKTFSKCIKDILSIDPALTILVEVIATKTNGMIEEAQRFGKISKNVVVKIPMTEQGLAAVKVLSRQGIKTTVTLVFSVNQAITAACAGTNYVAPFVGRLDDINADGVGLVKRIKTVFETQCVSTKVLAASIRTPQSVTELFSVGCDIVTMPGKILHAMIKHPLTEAGLKKFEEDWKKVPQV